MTEKGQAGKAVETGDGRARAGGRARELVVELKNQAALTLERFAGKLQGEVLAGEEREVRHLAAL
jgi:hypothetical protein